MHVTVLEAAIPSGQGLKQVGELALAFALASLIGLEREWRQKAAGLRTHTLVGFGAALFVLISKYGFSDVVDGHLAIVDPSRVAAQVVSGLGFIGGGLIFVRGDAVRGLTTAATVWLAAAIGMACGAGLAVLALIAELAYFITAFVWPVLAARLPRSRYTGFALRVVYADGRGILRQVLAACTERGFTIAQVATRPLEGLVDAQPAVAVELEIQGRRFAEPLTTALSELDGVHEVAARDLAHPAD